MLAANVFASLSGWNEAVCVLANMAEAVLGGTDGRRDDPDQDQPETSGSGGVGLRPSVDVGAGAGAHRVHRPAVCVGGAGDRVGVGTGIGAGHRRRPGCLRPVHRRAGRVPVSDLPGVPGRGRRGVRPGGVPTGPVHRGSDPVTGVGPADRHPSHRRRRCLRSDRLQRPPPAGIERHDE